MPADAHKSFVGRLARNQRDIEVARFQERNVLVAALGIARLNRKRRIGRVHDFGKGVAVERKAAAGRRGPQTDRGLWNGLASILRRSVAREQENGGANDTSEVHCRPPDANDE